MDPSRCGYQVRKDAVRAARTEWEHVVPAWTLGHQRQCWQKGGREYCRDHDPLFRAMEGDLFNLTVAVGEVNGDRANFNYGMVTDRTRQYGQCPSLVDFKARVFEPRDAVKGEVARIWFYMADRYGLDLSRKQQQLLAAWDRQFPVSAWECERDKRIAALTGRHNPFVWRASQCRE